MRRLIVTILAIFCLCGCEHENYRGGKMKRCPKTGSPCDSLQVLSDGFNTLQKKHEKLIAKLKTIQLADSNRIKAIIDEVEKGDNVPEKDTSDHGINRGNVLSGSFRQASRRIGF